MNRAEQAHNRTQRVDQTADLPSWISPRTSSPVQMMIIVAVALCCAGMQGAELWQNALAGMPLNTAPAELNRTNCVKTVLGAFTSNAVIRAVVFMPGATDELYLFRRVRVTVTNSSPSLLDVVTALTNQSHIRASFQAPFLLLHTDEDPLTAANAIEDEKTVTRLKRVTIERLDCDDWDWDALQPVLKRDLKLALRPWRYSKDSWHFYRHSFAAWNLNGLEALEVAALAGKSKFTLRRHEAVFEVDPRVLTAPRFDAHLR